MIQEIATLMSIQRRSMLPVLRLALCENGIQKHQMVLIPFALFVVASICCFQLEVCFFPEKSLSRCSNSRLARRSHLHISLKQLPLVPFQTRGFNPHSP